MLTWHILGRGGASEMLECNSFFIFKRCFNFMIQWEVVLLAAAADNINRKKKIPG